MKVQGSFQTFPADLSRSYAAAARAAGDNVTHVELPDAGHMDFLDPRSKAHATVCEWLAHAQTGFDADHRSVRE